MTLTSRELLLSLLCAVVLLMLNTLFTIPFWLLILSLLALIAVALTWGLIAVKSSNRKLNGIQKWLDEFDGCITTNSAGIFVSKPSRESSSIAWNDLVRIELVWTENPFEDPQFGSYCDTDWLLWCESSGDVLRLSESVNKSNSKILLDAFMKFLPGFNFDYVQFCEIHKGRIYELEGGKVIVWKRDA